MRRLPAILFLFWFTGVNSQEFRYDYSFFINSRMSEDYFFSSTKAEANSSIKSSRGRIPVTEKVAHSQGNALELTYINAEIGNWTATIFKQNTRGQDFFTEANYFSFWILNPSSSTANEDLPEVRLLKANGTMTNAFIISNAEFGKWTRVTCPISYFTGINANQPGAIVAVVFQQQKNDGKRHTIYVDDVEFLPSITANAVPNATARSAFDKLSAKGYARHIDISWGQVNDTTVKYVNIYRSEDGKEYRPVGTQTGFINRFADYTGETNRSYSYKIALLNSDFRESGYSEVVTASTRVMTDDELLTMVQEASFRYYWDGAEAHSGLAKENIAGRHNMVASGASGFGLLALIAGTERGFITRDESVARFEKILRFLQKVKTFHGAFSHFIDGPTGSAEPFFGKRDNGGDLVETSFLVQGLLGARAYFNKDNAKEKAIRDKITAIWEKIEWKWYRRYPNSPFLYWHWSPDQAWIINHRLVGWNETMVTYLLAIASPTHPIPATMYYTGWASQDSFAREYRKNWGGTDDGSMYKNGKTYHDIKLDVGVSNGGPLFFTHYSYLGYDPHQLTDKYTNYFSNNKNIALINYRHCVQNPGGFTGYGDSCWGLTASDGPHSYSADEPIVGRDLGKIAPTGAISSFPYTPEESMKALKNYYFNYGKFIWGEYGFRDAFNLSQNWCSDIYMGLNQAPMTVMIENYRTGLLWKLFMSDKDVKAGLKKLNALNK